MVIMSLVYQFLYLFFDLLWDAVWPTYMSAIIHVGHSSPPMSVQYPALFLLGFSPLDWIERINTVYSGNKRKSALANPYNGSANSSLSSHFRN